MPVVRASAHNIVVEDETGWHRIVKVQFGADGSLYVMFPSLRQLPGMVGLASLPSAPGKVHQVDLLEVGYTTSHLVKFAYHPDGRVHFSQSGKIRTDVIGSAVPLSSKTGHIFSARFQDIPAFEPPRANDRTHTALFKTDGITTAVELTCWRYDVSLFAEGQGRFFSDEPTGLRTAAGLQPGIFIAPPAASPYPSFVLFLALTFPGKLIKDFVQGMIFIGGFSTGLADEKLTAKRTLLLAQYPSADRVRFAAAVQSLDL